MTGPKGQTNAMRMVVLSLLGAAGACATGPSSQPSPPVETLPVAGLAVDRLGPGDVIDIQVFREPDLAGVYLIDSTGTIDFPLVGEVAVLKKTPREVQDLLEKQLEDGYLIDARVKVLVKERNSQKVTVLGAVQKPGSFNYEPSMTVIDAIAAAGGFSPVASKNGVTLTRVEGGRKRSYQVRAGDIQAGSAQNLSVLPGDILYVKEAIF